MLRDIVSESSSPALLRESGLEARPGLRHGFTTRALGTARPPAEAGKRAAAEPDAVARALEALGEEPGAWTRHSVEQVHGACARVVTAGSPAPPAPLRADALVTAEPGELLVVRTADCLPVLVAGTLFGEVVAVAAIHAGWRGLVAGVLDSALEELERLAPTARFEAALGPAIGPCCFEIGPEVAEPLGDVLGRAMLRPGEGDRSFADLPRGARRLLETRDVRVLGEAPPCTRCRPGRFHSHRADGGSAGRSAALIGFRHEA